MSGIRAEAETLPNGMEAIFIHQPHWQTSSARLIVHAGTLHEDDEAPTGVAHFFEHLTFQGTAKFDDAKALETYREDNYASMNARTTATSTTYIADGPALDPALNIVTQLSLAPTLDPEAIEKERGAIIDEARGHQFDPGEVANRMQLEALGGRKYGELGTGTIEQIANINQGHVQSYHDRHYRAANMLLVVCSSEPAAVQRRKALQYMNGIDGRGEGEPTYWNLPWLQFGKRISAVRSSLPIESQTHITLNYGADSDLSVEDNIALNMASGLLANKAHQRLRKELVVAYGAGAGTWFLENRSFGSTEKYGNTNVYTSTSGSETFRCLDELLNTVPEIAASDERQMELTVGGITNYLRAELEYTPSMIADNVTGNVLFRHRRIIEPSTLLKIASKITPDDIRRKIKETTEEVALVQITSPDETVLVKAEARNI